MNNRTYQIAMTAEPQRFATRRGLKQIAKRNNITVDEAFAHLAAIGITNITKYIFHKDWLLDLLDAEVFEHYLQNLEA